MPALGALLMLATPASALPQAMQLVSLCTGDGIRTIALPADGEGERPPKADCGKACHIGCDRKKLHRGR